MKKVSILTGIYNCADTLPEALDSVLAQTFSNWEMILCDDGSTDDTFAVASHYADLYPGRFIVIQNSTNLGLNRTLNRCLELASGEYIARMDGDDISLPTRLEKEVYFLDTHPEFAIVSCPMIYFDENGDWGVGQAIEIPQIDDFFKHAPFHCHAPCMIRREAFVAVGGYSLDKRTLRIEDCNLWFRLYAAGYRGYNLQEPLYKMRDGQDAYKRRSFKTRMNAVYVVSDGIKRLHLPKRYYIYVVKEFCAAIIKTLLPPSLYSHFHKAKRSNK